jgi:hypothetical protein
MSGLEALSACAGEWRGTNRLQDPNMNVADDSSGTATVTTLLEGKFVRLDYTWSYRGAPQAGSLLIGYLSDPAVVTAHWIDTWHMGESVMACRGARDADGAIDVRGSYAAAPGVDWGWRIQLRPVDGKSLKLVMYNATPEGAEELAVKANYRR